MEDHGLIDDWVDEIGKAPDAVIDSIVARIRSSAGSHSVPVID